MHVCIPMCANMRIEMCIGLRAVSYRCMDMFIDSCTDMCIEMWTALCSDVTVVCTDMCIDMGRVHGHVYELALQSIRWCLAHRLVSL